MISTKTANSLIANHIFESLSASEKTVAMDPNFAAAIVCRDTTTGTKRDRDDIMATLVELAFIHTEGKEKLPSHSGVFGILSEYETAEPVANFGMYNYETRNKATVRPMRAR